MSSPDASPHSSAPRRMPLWSILLIGLLLGLALFGDKGILRALQFSRQKEALQVELQRLEETNAALRQEIEALRADRGYIEDIARRELGMVKKDELVYQFPAQGGESGNGKGSKEP